MNRNEALSRHYGLLWYIARSLHGPPAAALSPVLGQDDLFQEAVIGAIKAIDTFRPDCGSLTAWINLKARGHVLDAKRRAYSVPQRRWREVKELLAVAEKLMHRLQREPCDEEIAEHVGLSIAEVESRRRGILESLPPADPELIPDDDEKRPDEQYAKKELHRRLAELIRSELDHLERLILVQHIVNKVPRRRLAEILDLSPKQIRRIESVAVGKVTALFDQRDYPLIKSQTSVGRKQNDA